MQNKCCYEPVKRGRISLGERDVVCCDKTAARKETCAANEGGAKRQNVRSVGKKKSPYISIQNKPTPKRRECRRLGGRDVGSAVSRRGAGRALPKKDICKEK